MAYIQETSTLKMNLRKSIINDEADDALNDLHQLFEEKLETRFTGQEQSDIYVKLEGPENQNSGIFAQRFGGAQELIGGFELLNQYRNDTDNLQQETLDQQKAPLIQGNKNLESESQARQYMTIKQLIEAYVNCVTSKINQIVFLQDSTIPNSYLQVLLKYSKFVNEMAQIQFGFAQQMMPGDLDFNDSVPLLIARFLEFQITLQAQCQELIYHYSLDQYLQHALQYYKIVLGKSIQSVNIELLSLNPKPERICEKLSHFQYDVNETLDKQFSKARRDLGIQMGVESGIQYFNSIDELPKHKLNVGSLNFNQGNRFYAFDYIYYALEFITTVDSFLSLIHDGNTLRNKQDIISTFKDDLNEVYELTDLEKNFYLSDLQEVQKLLNTKPYPFTACKLKHFIKINYPASTQTSNPQWISINSSQLIQQNQLSSQIPITQQTVASSIRSNTNLAQSAIISASQVKNSVFAYPAITTSSIGTTAQNTSITGQPSQTNLSSFNQIASMIQSSTNLAIIGQTGQTHQTRQSTMHTGIGLSTANQSGKGSSGYSNQSRFSANSSYQSQDKSRNFEGQGQQTPFQRRKSQNQQEEQKQFDQLKQIEMNQVLLNQIVPTHTQEMIEARRDDHAQENVKATKNQNSVRQINHQKKIQQYRLD
eukprot:403336605